MESNSDREFKHVVYGEEKEPLTSDQKYIQMDDPLEGYATDSCDTSAEWNNDNLPYGFPELSIDQIKDPFYQLAVTIYARKELIKTVPTMDDLKTTVSMIYKGVELSWRNVTITVPPSRKDKFLAKLKKKEPPQPKVILDDLSGRVPVGSFTINIGSQGSGKSTFMNYLYSETFGLMAWIARELLWPMGRTSKSSITKG
jgi:ABC-type multidrug transport system fused ATPase/permease subunit